MRFFGAPTVLLALGVSAVAGHSYHAFENGYEPVVDYGVLQTHQGLLHDSHATVPYEEFSEVPKIYAGIDDIHLNHGYNSYLEPQIHEQFEDVSHPELIGNSHYELHDNSHLELHGNSHHELHGDGHYELQGNSHQEIHDFGHNDHNDHHEHHENYVVHDNEVKDEHHDHDHKEEDHVHHNTKDSYEHHGNNDNHKEHEDKKHDDGHEEEQKSEANYAFKYGVNDPKTGDVKEQWESRTGDKVKGGYALKEADGTTRVVHYSADKKKGFEATVHKIGHPTDKTHSEHGLYI